MASKMDDLVDEKIEEYLGLYDTRGRRTANQIRDMIQEELERRPKTVHELSNAINATKATTRNHCEHLQELSVAERFKKEDQKYWRLSR